MTDVVGKLWGFCHVLRHDGVDYGDYIEQLTYLLFLKMADERGIELPEDTDWPYLRKQSGTDLLDAYVEALRLLGKQHGMLGDIFSGAQSRFTNPVNLHKLIGIIDETEWTALETDVKAAAFEGLLEKAAAEGKKGAGQYFTPRPLIQSIVRCVKPDPRASNDFKIGDPGCGTGGFLVASYEWLKGQTGGAFDRETALRIRKSTYCGQDLVARPRRLALMNLYLHQVEPHITLGDSIYEVPPPERFDVVLTNPPFGTKGANQAPARDDFVVSTSNKQLNFIQHVLTILKPGGRAAIIVPDNVLFASQAGEVFEVLMEDCDVHTVLRCPRGTFSPYTEGTKTNVIFFTKGRPTTRVWLYDARANIPKITKKSRPLTAAHFVEFEKCYGDDPNGHSQRRQEDSPQYRWQCFSIDEIKQRYYKLDSFRWLRDEEANDPDELPEPDELITYAMGALQLALDDLVEMRRLLEASGTVDTPSTRLTAPPHLVVAKRTIERARQAVLAAACSGRLTADWRENHDSGAHQLARVLRDASSQRRQLAEPQLDLVGDLPADWEVVTLDLLIDHIQAGKSFNALGRPAEDGEWGVIKVSAMSWGRFLQDENKAVPEERTINPAFEIRPGDLLLSRANTEELVGATVLVTKTRPRLLLSDKSLRLIPRSGIDKSWLNLTLQSRLVRAQFEERATGTSDSMRNLSQAKILSTTVPLASTAEQQEIVRRVDSLFLIADRVLPMFGEG